MNNTLYLLLFAIYFLTQSCVEKREQFYTAKINSEKKISLHEIQIDTLCLDKIESSYLGFLRVIDDSLFFIDNRFC